MYLHSLCVCVRARLLCARCPSLLSRILTPTQCAAEPIRCSGGTKTRFRPTPTWRRCDECTLNTGSQLPVRRLQPLHAGSCPLSQWTARDASSEKYFFLETSTLQATSSVATFCSGWRSVDCRWTASVLQLPHTHAHAWHACHSHTYLHVPVTVLAGGVRCPVHGGD